MKFLAPFACAGSHQRWDTVTHQSLIPRQSWRFLVSLAFNINKLQKFLFANN